MVHWSTSGLRFVVVGAVCAVAAVAQSPTVPALRRAFDHGGDAWLQVTFRSHSQDSGSRVGSDGERHSWSRSHDWEVSGVLELRTLAPAPGKRVFQVVGVAGGLQGRLSEAQSRHRHGIYGSYSKRTRISSL